MKIVVIDGQGGRLGKLLVEGVKARLPKAEVWALGTNSIATATMLKAGADCGATGENPVVRGVMDADAVLGPIGIAVTQIAAGTQHNVVPDTCRFVADVRTTDAYTNEETVEILRRALRSEVTPRSTRIRASALNAAHPLARATAATGRESYVSPTTSDMALMPFPSLKMGPGQSSRSHTADEFVLLSEIEEGIGIYEKFIKQLAEIL